MTAKEEFIKIYTENIKRKGADKLLEYLEKSDFFTAPSSTRYHGSYEGGLVEHSVNVYHCLKDYLSRPRVKEKYGMENNTFYMIGDTMRDYEAAKEADFHFIGVSYGYGSFPDNFEHPVADSVMEISEYI